MTQRIRKTSRGGSGCCRRARPATFKPAPRERPLIEYNGKFRPRDLSFKDLVVVFVVLFAIACWRLFGFGS